MEDLILKIKNLMRRVIKFLIIIFVFVILVFVALSFFTAGDRKIAKEFIISCCGSKTNEFVWYELLHDGLKKEVDKDKFAEMFAASQSYETVFFPQFLKVVLLRPLTAPQKQQLIVRRR